MPCRRSQSTVDDDDDVSDDDNDDDEQRVTRRRAARRMRRGRTPFDSAAAVAESARGVESDAMVMTDPKLSSNGVELGVQHPELPNHYAYIYKFRVEQCPLFLQHKCTSHRPFTCFHWHFQNQRRRKPVRRRDGTLNYSADEYCTRYDETTGQLLVFPYPSLFGSF